jgi:hypothetical protein
LTTQTVQRPTARTVSWTTLLAIAGFSVLAVYSTSMSLHTIDIETGVAAADISQHEYYDVLAGVRGYPYQWRLLGTYLVYGAEHITGLPLHAIDLALKTLLLWISTTTLFLFSRRYTSDGGAWAVAGLYLLLTVVGFTSEQYRIYFTNDYAMMACWFGAVYFVRAERYAAAAALTFVGAWAKETMVLVPVLVALEALGSRRARIGFVMVAAAFVIPTAMLRTIYRAPLAKWAWWDMMYANVPFLQSSLHEFQLTLKNNVKVALFYNVFWVVAARRAFTLSDRFMKALAVASVVYLLMAYPVIYIRELRHFLPLAIAVLPLSLNALEAKAAARTDPRE